MKKFIILIFLPALLLSSCKNYLDVTPQGKVKPETDEEFASIIHNILYNIENNGTQYVIPNHGQLSTLELITDNLDANAAIGKSYMPVYVGKATNILSAPINTFQSTVYPGLFSTVKDCNIVIDNIEGRTSALAKQTLSVAYAIKGVCYYNLIRLYCEPYDPAGAENQLGLPMEYHFDTETKQVPVRADLKATAGYAVELLKKSAGYHVSDPTMLFTEDVAKAYLAKLYFWMGSWDLAAPLCEELLEKPAYQLAGLADYAAMIQAKNAKLSEVLIRERTTVDPDEDFFLNAEMSDLKSRPVNAKLIKLFGSEPAKDVRWAVTCNKKRESQKMLAGKVRGSELCLMLAECYAHMGGPTNEAKALRLLNGLRRNRIEDVVDYTAATLPTPDATAIIKVDARGVALTPLMGAILDERRKELFMEGDRWFELKRNGRPEWWVIDNVMKYTTKAYLYTFPINKRDVAMSGGKLKQNPGYES